MVILPRMYELWISISDNKWKLGQLGCSMSWTNEHSVCFHSICGHLVKGLTEPYQNLGCATPLSICNISVWCVMGNVLINWKDTILPQKKNLGNLNPDWFKLSELIIIKQLNQFCPMDPNFIISYLIYQ